MTRQRRFPVLRRHRGPPPRRRRPSDAATASAALILLGTVQIAAPVSGAEQAIIDLAGRRGIPRPGLAAGWRRYPASGGHDRGRRAGAATRGAADGRGHRYGPRDNAVVVGGRDRAHPGCRQRSCPAVGQRGGSGVCPAPPGPSYQRVGRWLVIAAAIAVVVSRRRRRRAPSSLC
ncbi:MAG: hypothetical protein M5U19_17715 [Microthrixaceae bacterium]|nr:hypothetical protein [Microthrixaceae bacterium]